MKCCLSIAFLSLKDAVSNSDHFLERGGVLEVGMGVNCVYCISVSSHLDRTVEF